MARRGIQRLAGAGVVAVFLMTGPSGMAAAETSVDCGAGADLQAAIDAAPKGAILEISGRCFGTFTVGRNVTLRGVSGAVLDAGSSPTGPSTNPTLTITAGRVQVKNLVITGANTDVYPHEVGALVNSGTATLVRVTIEDNGGGFGVAGITNHGTITLQRSIVESNETDDGWAIANGGTAIIKHSTIRNNQGTGIGGGTLTMIDSTVSGNHSITGAGGMLTGGVTTITGSTIAGNSDQNGNETEGAGGIHNVGTLTVTSSTITGNHGDDGAGGFTNDGTATFAASIIAGNDVSGLPSDCDGTVESNGYNLIGTTYLIFPGPIFDSTCDFHARATDEVGGTTPINPALNPLGSYGGPTQTVLPKPTSPAINKIPIGATSSDGTMDLCPASGTTDQRGIARPQGPGCDIGSVERKPTASP